MSGGTTVTSDSWLVLLCGGLVFENFPGASLLFAVLSSASSVISFSLRRRRELEEEVIDPEAACSKHAEDNALSVSSGACERVNTLSCGENLSRIDWNWTVTLAVKVLVFWYVGS